jgi:hypothetical protein
MESGDFRLWHVAKFCCNAKLSRHRGMADIEQAALIKLDFISTPYSEGFGTLLGAQTGGVVL